MEQDFYQEDELANFLNEATADFKMYPSRRIWYSLYNNLHPGRKWPSFAVAIFLIAAILYMGVSNNNSINTNLLSEKNKIENRITNPAVVQNNSQNRIVNNGERKSNSLIQDLTDHKDDDKNLNSSILPASIAGMYISPVTTPFLMDQNISSVIPGKTKTDFHTSELIHPSFSNPPASPDIKQNTAKGEMHPEKILAEENNSTKLAKNENKNLPIGLNKEKKASDIELKSWLDDYAFYNKPKNKSFDSRSSIMYYVTPSIGFRYLAKKNEVVPQAAASSIQGPVAPAATSVSSTNINDRVTQHSSINMEVGASLIYKVTGNLSLRAGVQFNYTNYILNATKLDHSIETEIYVVDKSGNHMESRASRYVNAIRKNNNTLNSSTTQISVPLGAEWKIAGKNKLKWFAGASVQPGLVIGGNVYALSANDQYYINEPSLLRKGNINTSFETYLSYRTGVGVSIIAGPQVRYQIFSTYKPEYNYTEKLYNLGVKLGVVKSF